MQRATRGRAHLLTFAENTSLHSSPGPVEISPKCFLYCPSCSPEDSSNCWSSCFGMLQELRGEDRQVRVRDFHWMPEKVLLSAGNCSEQRRKAFIATPRGDTRTRTGLLLRGNVSLSLGRGAAATNDESNTAAAAVGAPI